MAMLNVCGWLADLQQILQGSLHKLRVVLLRACNVFDLITARHCFAELESLMSRFADAITSRRISALQN